MSIAPGSFGVGAGTSNPILVIGSMSITASSGNHRRSSLVPDVCISYGERESPLGYVRAVSVKAVVVLGQRVERITQADDFAKLRRVIGLSSEVMQVFLERDSVVLKREVYEVGEVAGKMGELSEAPEFVVGEGDSLHRRLELSGELEYHGSDVFSGLATVGRQDLVRFPERILFEILDRLLSRALKMVGNERTSIFRNFRSLS